MAKKNIIFFTNTYPYGNGEQWKSNEIEVFQHYFDRIIIVPLHYGNNRNPLEVPRGVKVMTPLFEHPNFKLSLKDRLYILKGPLGYMLKELLTTKALINKQHFNNWNSSAWLLTKLLKSDVVRQLFQMELNNSVFYFYWGIRMCDLIPFIKKRFPEAKYYVRFHGFDLYEERNRGYIPFRKNVLRNLNAAIAISDYGAHYLDKKYSEKTGVRIIKNRLGVPFAGVAGSSDDGVLRVVSCASLIPLKRVHLIYETLILLKIPVEWKHIGGGVLMDELKELIRNKRVEHVKVQLTGQVAPAEVMKHYAGQAVDLFLHVSETEGVPVSVMEALSASVPVIATDAGGTKELVDTSCGRIIPVDFQPQQLAQRIMEFYRLDEGQKRKMKEAALDRFRAMCDANRNARELLEELSR